MKKLSKKATGGPSNPKLKAAISDSTAAANYKKTPAYNKANSAVKNVVQKKLDSPSRVRAGKPEEKFGSTPVKNITLKKKGGAVKAKKK